MAARANCLIVASASPEGVSAQSFVHAFTLTTSAFNVQLASPGGKPVDFVKVDESSKRWLADFASKPYATPAKLENIDPTRFSAMLFPSSPGAMHDLATDQSLSRLLTSFISDGKPICAVGMGVTALCAAVNPEQQHNWKLKGYSLTGPSTFQLASLPNFANLPLIPEDFIRDNGGTYSCNHAEGGMHVVIDRHVITGQNDFSTLTAVQNLILLCNARQQSKR